MDNFSSNHYKLGIKHLNYGSVTLAWVGSLTVNSK